MFCEHLQSWPSQHCPKMQDPQAELPRLCGKGWQMHPSTFLRHLAQWRMEKWPNSQVLTFCFMCIVLKNYCVSQSLFLGWRSTQLPCVYLHSLLASFTALVFVNLQVAGQPEAIGKGRISLRSPLKWRLPLADARCFCCETRFADIRCISRDGVWDLSFH